MTIKSDLSYKSLPTSLFQKEALKPLFPLKKAGIERDLFYQSPSRGALKLTLANLRKNPSNFVYLVLEGKG
jgi:hypothetical protein